MKYISRTYGNGSKTKKFCSRCGKLISATVWYCPTCTKRKELEEERLKKERCKRYNKERYKDENNLKIKRFYGSKDWETMRKIILIRDNYLCVHCFKKGIYTKAETVHHKVEIEQAWELRLDKENLISLCNKCHNKVHNRF